MFGQGAYCAGDTLFARPTVCGAARSGSMAAEKNGRVLKPKNPSNQGVLYRLEQKAGPALAGRIRHLCNLCKETRMSRFKAARNRLELPHRC